MTKELKMKIDAKVEFSDEVALQLERSFVRVPVDMDYVEGNEQDIRSWIANELEDMFGRSFMQEDFEVKNMEDIIEEINFDDFEDKTN
jgi:uncharacterized membrane protein